MSLMLPVCSDTYRDDYTTVLVPRNRRLGAYASRSQVSRQWNEPLCSGRCAFHPYNLFSFVVVDGNVIGAVTK